MKLYSRSISLRNTIGEYNKPNEDYFLCDSSNGIYILVDGVSRDKKDYLEGIPSPSKMVSEIFVDEAYYYLVNNIEDEENTNELIEHSIIYGNESIKKFNKKQRWKDNFLPGTVGIVLVIKENKAYYGYIGDCYGVVISKLNKNIFTTCQTKKISEHKGEFSAKEIRNKICNNKKHPYSYGVLNGDLKAIDFVESGILDITKENKIILSSDGFSDIIEEYDALKLFDLSFDLGKLDDLSKTKDDKSMIVIEFS